MNRLQQQVEVTGDTATIYLSGIMCYDDAEELMHSCDGLPPRVRSLRLDLHGVTQLASDGIEAVRNVLKQWRATRGGDFRLSFRTDHIIATYSEGRFIPGALDRARPTGGAALPAVDASPNLTAMYL